MPESNQERPRSEEEFFAPKELSTRHVQVRMVKPFEHSYHDWLAEEATNGRVGTPQKYAAFKAGWIAALTAVMESEDYKKRYG